MQWVAAGWQAGGRAPQPDGVAVLFGEYGGGMRADEGVPRPHAAVFGRLEQEGASSIQGKLLVDADWRLGVRQQPPRYRNDAPVFGQDAELIECWPRGHVSTSESKQLRAP